MPARRRGYTGQLYFASRRMTSLVAFTRPAQRAQPVDPRGGAKGWPKRQTAVVEQHGKSTARSLTPIGAARVDARYRQANERNREDGQDDIAHASLLNEEPCQPPSV
jgi:hypothetical protein